VNWEFGLFVGLGLGLAFGVGATEYVLDDLHRRLVGGRSAHGAHGVEAWGVFKAVWSKMASAKMSV
jgi:hypothetical protein